MKIEGKEGIKIHRTAWDERNYVGLCVNGMDRKIESYMFIFYDGEACIQNLGTGNNQVFIDVSGHCCRSK